MKKHLYLPAKKTDDSGTKKYLGQERRTTTDDRGECASLFKKSTLLIQVAQALVLSIFLILFLELFAWSVASALN
uniref:Uncharacterized protein n=1 Tax=Globodera rostochiensis TaxID=31243 RepID=A0A914HQJ9_GLORO